MKAWRVGIDFSSSVALCAVINPLFWKWQPLNSLVFLIIGQVGAIDILATKSIPAVLRNTINHSHLFLHYIGHHASL